MKMGITRTHVMSARSLFITLITVGVVTGGNLWIHSGDPPIGYVRYSGHGLSFDYTAEMSQVESDLGGFGPTTDSGGSVQVRYQDADRLEQYGVMWVKHEIMLTYLAHTPESALDYLFEIVGIGGTQITDRSQYMTTTTDSHDVIYQTFGVPESGLTIPGIIGVWYCEETGRFLMFYLVFVEDFENIEIPFQGLEQMWHDYLNDLTCHGIQSEC